MFKQTLKGHILKKNLTTAGNTWQLYLNKPIAQLIGINKDEYSVLMKIENNILFVEKITNEDALKTKDSLIKKLIKRGSGFGLNLSLPILELLNINPEEDFVDIEIEGNKLMIKRSL